MPSISDKRILQGPLPLEVARFGIPLAIGMGLQTTFNLVDAYIISRLGGEVGSESLAAIGICDQVAALGTILSYGISIATGAILSRKRGEGDEEGVRRVAWQSLLLLAFISVIFSLIGVLGAKLVMHEVVGAKGQVAVLGTRYLRVMVGGGFTVFLLLHLITIQRALGSSKTPIVFLVVSNVINFLLAVLFVYGPSDAPPIFAWGPPIAELLHIPRMELMGAAWATVIARLVALVPLFFLAVARFGLFRHASRVRPHWATMRQIWHIGWPTSSQLVVRIIGILLVLSLVTRAYTEANDQSAATALGVVLRLETMALFVSLGWGSAAQTFMGQNLGARQFRRALTSGMLIALYNGVMMVLFALLCFFFGESIVAFFNDEPMVVSTAHDYLRWVSPSYVGLGAGIVLGSAIQGAGATRQTLLLDSLVVLTIQLPISLIVVFGFKLPDQALWQVIAFTYYCFAAVYLVSYRRAGFLRTTIE
jgi:putative MATE family efflux protein